MLRACFVGSLSPKWAENILIKRNRGSYLVRQSDLDPDQLLLSYVSEKGIKHVIVPEFEDSIYFSKLNKLKNKLDDESVDVQKVLSIIILFSRHPKAYFASSSGLLNGCQVQRAAEDHRGQDLEGG